MFMKQRKEVAGLKPPKPPPCRDVPHRARYLMNSSETANLYEVVEGCLSVDSKDVKVTGRDKVPEIAV